MRWNTLLKSLLILLVLTAVAACSDSSNPVDPAPDPEPDPGKADVNAALNALPAWQQVSPPVAESRDGHRGAHGGAPQQTAGSFSTGCPAWTQASKPPARLVTRLNPMRSRMRAAMAPRPPLLQ